MKEKAGYKLKSKGEKTMIRRIKEALKPDRNKWFDLNDLKMLGLSVLALSGTWFMVTFIILALG